MIFIWLLLGVIVLIVFAGLWSYTTATLSPPPLNEPERAMVGAARSTGGSGEPTNTAIDAEVLRLNRSVIPPPTNPLAPATIPNASEVLLATTSAASKPVYNTILQSELTLSQQSSIDKYMAGGDQIVATSSGTPLAVVPDSFDSRDQWPGLIGQPLDQLECGSCWSFGSSGSFADRVRIHARRGTNTVQLHLDQDTLDNSYYDETVLTKTDERLLTNAISYRGENNYLDTLSPYYFAGCNVCGYSFNLDPNIASIFTSRNLCGNCCSGSVVSAAHVWMLLNGIIAIGCDDATVQYTCSAGNGCPVYRPKSVYRVNKYLNSQLATATPAQYLENEEAIKRDIATNGPVATSMYVYENFAGWPAGTVYDDTQGTSNSGGHCVSIIGYGTRANPQGIQKPCWIVRNSWSEAWGDSGYFYILRGSNFCRIESDIHAGIPFDVYNPVKTPSTIDLSTLAIATSCSAPPGLQAVVNPSS